MSNQLDKYRLKLAKLSLEEEKQRREYLIKLNQGIYLGPMTGFPSIDEPWLKNEKNNIDMPNPDQTVYHYIYESNKDHLDDVAIIYDPSIEMEPIKITYREFFEKIDEVAKAYTAIGIRKGDIVTVSLPNLVENIVNFYALNKIGAITNQIHPEASQNEIGYYLNEAESKVFVGFGNVYEEKIKKIDNKYLKHTIIITPDDLNPSKKKIDKEEKLDYTTKCMTWSQFISKSKNVTYLEPFINYDSNLLASLTHTSGTEGKSKAVMTTSKAYNYSVDSILRETNTFKRHDKDIIVLPPFPLYILNNGIHLSLSVGEQIIIIPKVDYSNLSSYFKKHKPQHMKAIPSIVEAMVKDKGFNNHDMSYFKLLISGGGRLTNEKELNEFLESHNAQNGVSNGYGMSEAGGVVTFMFDDTKEKGTVGRPIINSCIKIIDEETKEEINISEDKPGDIYIKGLSIMNGYYQNEEATNDIFYKDKEGIIWVKTGDIGKITKDGNLMIVGRKKRKTFVFDKENNNASKVSHDYMEHVICKNDNVEDAIVVAIPDEISRHAFKAYIVIKDESKRDETIKELDEVCKKTFRKYISPVEYIVIDAIPKTKAGKNDFKYLEAYENNSEVKKEAKIKVLSINKISGR